MGIKNYLMSVNFNKSEMNEMENIIKKFLLSNNIELSIPVDIFEIASNIGFDIRGSEFREHLEGLILVNENESTIAGFNSNKVIAYNCKMDIDSKKFIVAYELAHYIEEKTNNDNTKIVIAARDHAKEYSYDVDEQRKDYIAAALLIPKDDFIHRFPKDSVNIDEAFFQKVSKIYNVNYDLAKRRVKEINSYE